MSVRSRVVASLLLVLGLVACDSSAPPPPPVLIALVGTLPTTATVGSVAASPRIEIRDANGRPRAGIPFTVSITGGGSIEGLADRTGSGSTTIGAWTLGTTAGPQTLTVTSGELPSVTLSITAAAGAAANAVAATSNAPFTALGGSVAPVVPSVRVRDAFGNLVGGVPVTVELVGGGSVATAAPVTGSDGVASTGAWTLPATEGTAEVRLRVGSLPPVVFRATVAGFSLSIRYVGTPPSAAIQAAFAAAATRVQRVIIGDLQEIPLSGFDYATQCDLPGAPIVDEVVDDLIIFVAVQPIDGVGNILGQAGPCIVRTGSRLPVLGDMIFDSADLDALAVSGDLNTVIVHEILHVIGIGTIWGPSSSGLGLTSGTGGPNPTFLGAQARMQYELLGGNVGVPGVPLENTGGPGTRDGHWRESVFGRELMTGFLNAGVLNPFSGITAGALRDLGYTVDLSAADAYAVSPLFRALQRASGGAPLGHTTLRGARFTVSPQGERRRMVGSGGGE